MSRAAVTTTNEPQCGASGVLGERNEPDWSYCCVVLRVPSPSPGLQRILQYTASKVIVLGNGTWVIMISHALAAMYSVCSYILVHISTWVVGNN